jgi:hypothetical protein
MRLKILILIYDFMQVLISKMKLNTKNDYLFKQIQFSTNYLLEQ